MHRRQDPSVRNAAHIPFGTHYSGMPTPISPLATPLTAVSMPTAASAAIMGPAGINAPNPGIARRRFPPASRACRQALALHLHLPQRRREPLCSSRARSLCRRLPALGPKCRCAKIRFFECFHAFFHIGVGGINSEHCRIFPHGFSSPRAVKFSLLDWSRCTVPRPYLRRVCHHPQLVLLVANSLSRSPIDLMKSDPALRFGRRIESHSELH